MKIPFSGWIAKKQRVALDSEVVFDRFRAQNKELGEIVKEQRKSQMKSAQVSPVNPVYDRIKGRGVILP